MFHVKHICLSLSAHVCPNHFFLTVLFLFVVYSALVSFQHICILLYHFFHFVHFTLAFIAVSIH